MDFARIFRHLWYGNIQVSSRFPRPALDRIEAALKESEKTHGGEIRFAVESSLDLPDLLRGMTARDRAVEVFSRLRVWDTEANNGVLVYLLLADHDVEILADRGIHAKVGPAGWEAVCREMEAAFRAGRFEDGVVKGIRDVGALLARHFPRTGGDLNELPDAPVVL
jgi:uncharacterized membrane protein